MADYYTQCAFELELKTDAELEYLRLMLEEEEALLLEHDDGWGWEYQFSARLSEPNAVSVLYLQDDGAGGPNIDAMVTILQGFLRQFRPKEETLAFTWAHTCSKPRPGAFSGGGVVFSAEHKQFIDVAEELGKLCKQPPFSP